MKGYNNHYSSIRFTSFSFLLLVFCLWSSVFSLSFCLQPVNSAEIDGQSPASNSDRAQFSNEPHDVFYLMDEQRVSIASKMKEKVKNAPSIVTVITAEEIEDMGFRTLPEVLRIVPGFDIIKSGAFGEIIPGVRGLRNADNKIKVHIDGHSLNTPYNGESRFFFDDISLKNVKKIEIIRGPGSALYGSNAFLAVINIITKDADDIDGIEVTSGFGSFDTQEYSVMFGKTLHDIDITGFVDFYNTNGQSDTIKEDPFFGQPFSITPGDTDDGRKRFDTYLKLSYKDLQFIAKYTNKDTEPFVGSNLVLTDDGTNSFNYVMGELNYKFDIGEQLTVKPRVYYDQYDIEFFPEIFPDGFVIPDVDMDGEDEEFPDGMRAQAIATNRRLGFEIQTDYYLSDNNTFTLGFDYKWERQDNVTFHANFDPLTGASLGSIQNVSDTANWIRRVYRQIWAVYIQDKWDITNNIGLTIGIRHDHFSDFGGTTNPRIALVWDFMENATLKLLYGQAFRAPAFDELYTINNPVVAGSSDLKPETIRTYEVGLGYKFTDRFSANVNYFFNVIRDEIKLGPRTNVDKPRSFANRGGSNVQGIEFETRANLGDFWKWGAYAFANYTYLDAESKGDPLPDVPKHKGNIGVNLGITKYLNANLHTFISGSRIRAEADTRDDSPGYALMNLTLTAKDFFKGFKVKASLFNLLDKKYDDPAPINTIPTDLPRPGRTFYIELGYEW